MLLVKRVLLRPLGLLKGILVPQTRMKRSSRNNNNSMNDLHHQRKQNIDLKLRVIALLAIAICLIPFMLSRPGFSLENYGKFKQSMEDLNVYLFLNRDFTMASGLYKFFSLPRNIISSDLPTKDQHESFNQNYTISAYLSHLARVYEEEEDPENYLKKHKLKFHWGDWIDLSSGNAFIKSHETILNKMKVEDQELFELVRDMCFDRLYDVNDPWMDPQLQEARLFVNEHLQSINVCSSVFKYYYSTLPERVVFETDFKYFELPVDNKQRKDSPFTREELLRQINPRHDMVPELVDPNNREELLDSLEKIYLRKGFTREDLKLKPTLSQDQKNFKPSDVPAMIKEYEAIPHPTLEEQKYLEFLRYSNQAVWSADKFYFTFPYINIDTSAELHHYTFPWFKQIISREERIKVIHHLIRSWFKYAEHAGIVSWFNYGNLIGWYFNGQNLPWDNDVDVQVSITDQDKIGRFHNNTLVVENPKLGDHMFWLQTNPYYLQHNDKQFIDARYIDVKTGIYIDISALWESNHEKPKGVEPKEGEIAIHCKHYNFFVFSDIFPLKRTLFEGAQAYMPNNIEGILQRFYKNPIGDLNIFDHNWQADVGIWVPNQICELDSIPKTQDRFNPHGGGLTLSGACNNTDLLNEYDRAKEMYRIHLEELELIINGTINGVKSDMDSTIFSEKDLPIFRHFEYEDYR